METIDAECEEFYLGDIVNKKDDLEWQGKVVGFHAPSIAIEGYAVESLSHKGSVQIYPAKALIKIEAE